MQGRCSWTVRTDTLFKSHEVTFRLGEAGRDTTMDGRTIDFVVERPRPNALLETQRSRGKTTTLLREFSADAMRVTLRVGDVVSTSVFLRQVSSTTS